MSYVELYGAYAETEAVFSVDRLLALFSTLPPDDQQEFGFDPAIIDWTHFCHDVYLPSVVAQARVRLASSRSREGGAGPSGLDPGEERGRRAILAPERQLAVFDLENTLIAANVVDSYAWLATRHIRGRRTRPLRGPYPGRGPPPAGARPDRPGRFPALLLLAVRAALPVDRRKQDSWELFSDLILTKAFPAGIRRVREHRARGHKTLLITGGPGRGDRTAATPLRRGDLRPIGEKERPFHRRAGRGPTQPGEARASIMADFARDNGIDLEQSVAYADSASDLAMLEAAGHPVAVNPETKLAAIARKRGWHVEHGPCVRRDRVPCRPIGPRSMEPIRILRS